MAHAVENQRGVAVLHRPLQPELGGRGHGPELVQIEHDQGEARAPGEQIGGAQRDAQSPPALHPQQRGEIHAGRRGRGGIERIHAIHVGHLPVSRDPGDEGQEQAAAS